MSNQDINSQNKYISIISSIANVIAPQVEGVASVSCEPGAFTGTLLPSTKKRNNRSVCVEIVKEMVIVDISINAKYGYKVPELVCALQERLIEEIEKATCYKVKAINVNIVGVVF